MTAYSPRHAVAVPRAPRRPSRVRRLLLALLPARKVTVSLAAEPLAPFADRFRCCEHCLTGCPCEPQDSHRMPCKDGCNDPLRPVTLTGAEIAALRPVWAVRRDGLVTVSETGDVEVYPAPLAWEASGQPTAAQPALDEEAAELARAEQIRRQMRGAMTARDPKTLERVLDGLRNLPGRGDYGVTPVARVLEGERLAKRLIA